MHSNTSKIALISEDSEIELICLRQRQAEATNSTSLISDNKKATEITTLDGFRHFIAQPR
ncbi:MAG: hypothetical protein ACJAYF_003501 [Arenicella sp.]|jgi:hypothetical protein